MNEESPISFISFPINQYGFSFPNRFKLNGKNRIFKVPVYYGLCGGMCFTALDAFHSQVNLPRITHPEHIPKTLYSYLLTRQLNSTSLRSLLKLVYWIFRDDRYLQAQTTNSEVPLLINHITKGHPIPIVVVRSKNFQNPTNNHQVLVLGFQQELNKLKLKTYDPNYPDCYTEIFLEKSPDSDQIQIIHSTGETDRGFFVNHYKPKSPVKIFNK